MTETRESLFTFLLKLQNYLQFDGNIRESLFTFLLKVQNSLQFEEKYSWKFVYFFVNSEKLSFNLTENIRESLFTLLLTVHNSLQFDGSVVVEWSSVLVELFIWLV